jgi:fermentation-respiration switch protein FrsA (DUF1100 family)
MKKPTETHNAGNHAHGQHDSAGNRSVPASLPRKLAAISWRIARLVLIAYLVVVLAMMLLERSLVYPAPALEAGDWKASYLPHEDVSFASADGTKLHGWFFSNANAKRAILYCHGNGEDVAAFGELALEMRDQLNASVFVFDYRGYGHSQGKPDEPGCIADGSAAQHWLAKRMNIQSNEVVLIGRSLGSAVAIALAAQNGARALVLQNAFSRMTDVAALHYPWLPVRLVMSNRYDNLAEIQKYTGPLLQSHGTRDEFIPIASARQLFDSAPSNRKKWIEQPNLRHNSPLPATYLKELDGFLNSPMGSASTAEIP